MKRRTILLVTLIVLAAFGAGIGTFAYYSTQFTSEGNAITAAKWDVTSDKLTKGVVGQKSFEISKFAPGLKGEFSFALNENGTEVPVVFDFQIIKDGELLSPANSPIVIKLFDSTGTELTNLTDVPGNGGNNVFKLKYEWPWGTGIDPVTGVSADNAFQGLTGTIKLIAIAKQAKTEANGDKVLYGSINSRDKTTSPVSNGTGTARLVVNSSGVLISMEGYDSILGKITYDSVNGFKSELRTNWNGAALRGTPIGALNVNGVYQFQLGGGTGTNGERNLEIKPVSNP